MKNKFKRILAMLLATIMVITMPVVSMAEETEEDSGIDLMSLFPIEEVYAYIDLAEIPIGKLPQITVSELFGYLKESGTGAPIDIGSADASVWANFFNEEGNYRYDVWEVLDLDESINILKLYDVDGYDMEVVVGSGNQLDPENVRYHINLEIPNQYSRMDLHGYVYDELYDFSVSDIVENISGLRIKDMESVEILWFVEELVHFGCEFDAEIINGWLKLGYGDSVKFAPTLEEIHTGNWWNRYNRMVIKFDDTTVLYDINVEYPEYVNMFEYSIYTQDITGKRTEVGISDVYGYESGKITSGDDTYYYDIQTEIKSHYSKEDEYYLGIKLRKEFADCDLKIIKGWEDEDAARSWIIDGKIPEDIDLTSELVVEDMGKENAGLKDYWLQKYRMEITLCILSDNDIYIVPACISISHTYDSVYVEGIFTDIDNERISIDEYMSHRYVEEEKGDEWYYTEIVTYYLNKDYISDCEHSVCMEFYDGDTQTGDASKVEKAVVGHFYSLEEAKGEPDIKKQLFAEDMYAVGAGYKADFSGDGVDFTIFTKNDIHHFKVITKESEYEEEPEPDEEDEAPEVGYEDRHFRVLGLYGEDGYLDTYTVPYQYDTYYSYGYQTLLINDTEVDMTAISPDVNLSYQTKVYYGDTMENTVDNYYNRLSPRDFTKAPVDLTRDPHSSVRYTVSAQDHTKQKNYWVTAVKKEEAATLFVNGPDEREIFLNNYFGNAHDIFVANVGGEELTGITVTIDATNIKLDDYWTVGGEGNNTLAPFTATYNNTGNSGELFNVARIRLVPDGEGEIEGTLTISADGQEPRVITLTGTAGNPKIDTTAIHDAVKYVPYSSIITTNNMHDWNRVTFSIDEGRLPDGLTLYPSGEIYGVPKETGEFPITVRARYSHSEFEDSYAELVLTVKDNSDANINASVDDGYEITTRLPANISEYADMDFVIDGEFAEFVDLWLDGEKLALNVDYTAIEGSTKITIKSKTFSNVGKGKHTISAEFRVGGDKNNELKTASQNFTIGGSSPVIGGGGGGGGVTTYVVTFETNGGSAVEKQNVKKGNTISALPTPAKEGYVFAGWFKDEALTQPMDASEKITSKVTLYAKWDVIIPDKAPVEASEFVDVATGDWFFEDVQWAYANNIMVGYNNAQFAPSDAITSSMVVTVLARLANADITTYENKHMEGVEDGQWYTPYANWSKETGIAEDISFAALGEINRETMGVVLVRFLEYMEKEFVVTEEFVEFADADQISDKAMNSIQTLYKLGIIKGKGNNIIDPMGKTTRGEFAALIHRVYTLLNE